MEEQKMEDKRIQWHPAFFAGIQIELEQDAENVDAVKIEEVTISFICSKYPQKLICHLREERNYEVISKDKGIYQVIGDVLPIQIIVTNRLTHKENIWLKSLTGEVEETAVVDTLLRLYDGNKKNPLYDSVMNLIVRNNKNKFEEATGMCEALEELKQKKLQKKPQKMLKNE